MPGVSSDVEEREICSRCRDRRSQAAMRYGPDSPPK